MKTKYIFYAKFVKLTLFYLIKAEIVIIILDVVGDILFSNRAAWLVKFKEERKVQLLRWGLFCIPVSIVNYQSKNLSY